MLFTQKLGGREGEDEENDRFDLFPIRIIWKKKDQVLVIKTIYQRIEGFRDVKCEGKTLLFC